MCNNPDPKTQGSPFPVLPRRGGGRRNSCGLLSVVVLLLAVSGPQFLAQGETAQEAAAQADPVDEARATAEARVAAAQRAKDDGESLRLDADFSLTLQRDANLESTWQRGERVLQAAQEGMLSAASQPSESGYRDAGIMANGARRAFEDFAARTRRVYANLAAERAPPPPPVAEPEPAAEPTKDEESTPPPANDPTAADDDAQPGQAQPGQTQPIAAPPASAPPPPRRRPVAAPPSGTDQPPQLTSAEPLLARAIEAFFQGDDQRVLSELTSLQGLSAGAQTAHALMLRAASRYNLYLLGGERDYALRSAAVEDVQACQRLYSDISPPRELFSPRFVDFFASTQ